MVYTSTPMKNRHNTIEEAISSLRQTLNTLRGENGCPWDRAQTMDSIITDLIDEGYELLQAEKSGRTGRIIEELGDVFFLWMFTYQLLAREEDISLQEVISRAHAKIIRRHPHVFGDSERVETVSDSIRNWERVKKKEKENRKEHYSMNSLPPVMPPLRKAGLLQKMAADFGFDWPGISGIMEKLEEEKKELEESISRRAHREIREEIGDILFTVVNLARRLNVEPENALEETNSKFHRRFRRMEELAGERGEKLESLPLHRMEELWQESKEQP